MFIKDSCKMYGYIQHYYLFVTKKVQKIGSHWISKTMGSNWSQWYPMGHPIGYHWVQWDICYQYLKFETPKGILLGMYKTTMVINVYMKGIRFQPFVVFELCSCTDPD